MEPEQTSEQDSTSGPSTTTADLFAVDDRLLRLERRGDEHREYLLQLQDVQVELILTVVLIEIVFAIFLASSVWLLLRERPTSKEAV